MAGCEGFEIAIEMRLHGAADAGASAGLNAHLATCASCREFEAAVRRMENSMKRDSEDVARQIDWSRLSTRVQQLKTENWIFPLGLLLSFVVLVAGVFLVTGPIPAWRDLSSAVGVVVVAFLLLFSYSSSRAATRLREARNAEESREKLLAYWRKALEERTRRLRRYWLTLPLGAAPLLLLTAWNAHRAHFPVVVLVLSDALLPALFIGLALDLRFVQLPRLEREREELE
jgi:hypothetical protein